MPPSPLTLNWSKWFSLFEAGRNKSIPSEAGIYRIRRVGGESLDYVGQTGRGLRERLGELSGVYKPIMPYNDPHTAGPAFWALRQLENCEYEASVASVSGSSTPHRKGLECVVIAEYRQEYGHSPTFNFGRMPSGYSKSTSNTRSLAARGKRRRGDITDEILKCHLPGIGPVGPIDGSDAVGGLLGLNWSPWASVAEALDNFIGVDVGLYLLRRSGGGELVYIGQGKIMDRVKTHIKKGGQTDHPQAFAFSDAPSIEVSFILRPDLAKHQLLEIENDLIAAHVIQMGVIPSAQFLG